MLIALLLAPLAAPPIHTAQALDYPYATAEPQKTGWPLTEEEGAYVLKPEHERRPGSEQTKYLPAMWPVTPSAGYWGGSAWLDAHAKLVENARANKGFIDILLVGDSITQQWGGGLDGKPFNAAWQKTFGRYKTVNIGIGGDKTQNVLWRLDHGGVAGLEPRLVVLLIGNNNMFFTPETGIEPAAQGIKVCVANIRENFPKAHVLVLKVFPAHAPGNRFYEDIKKVNAALDKINLEADPKVHVLDLWNDMVNPDGTLKKGVFTSDNIHLTQEVGYEILAGNLKPVVDNLLGGDGADVNTASSLIAEAASSQTTAADPVAAVFERMKHGICVGHFERDQDQTAVAEVNADYLDSIRSAGFNSIRFFFNSNRKPEFFAANITYALKQGLVVNVCMFAFTKDKQQYVNRWREIATFYKDYPESLVFEMFNEPSLAPKLNDPTEVMDWINAAVAVIREVSPKRILLIGGPSYMQAPFLSKYVTPEYLTYTLAGGGFAEDRCVMGAFHMYEPHAYTMPKGKLVTVDDFPNWKKLVTGNFDLAAAWGKKWNKRVVLTEWGAQNVPKKREDFLGYTKFVFDEVNRRDIASMYYAGLPRNSLMASWNILDTEFGWDQGVLDIITRTKAKPVPSFNQLANSEFREFEGQGVDRNIKAWEVTKSSAASVVNSASLSGVFALKLNLDAEPVTISQDTLTMIESWQKTDPMFAHETALQKPFIHLRRGNTYRLTFLARAEKPGATATVRLENAADNGAVCFSSKPLPLATRKEEYAFEYTHTGDDIMNARVALMFSGGKNTVFVDRAMLKSQRDMRLNTAAPPTAATPWTLGERNGRMCLLTPEGKPLLMLGISHVGGAFAKAPAEDRAVLKEKIERELRGWHFNTVPSPEFWDRFPFIVPLDRLVGDQEARFEDVFDPAFKARLRKKIAAACEKTKNNPNCIGYWWTDIPPWTLGGPKKKFGKNWVDFIRDLPDTAPGKKRYAEFLAAPGPHDDVAFLRLIARELYTDSAKLFRELDPQRLIFGERYNTFNVPNEILEEAAKVVDVISVQPYESQFNEAKYDAWHKLTGKPMVISDWNLSFPTPDHAVTMWPQFPTQAAAAEAYETYLRAAFAKPYILGYFKCQYVDQVLPTGMLKQGLHWQDGRTYEEFAGLLTGIHQRLIEQLEKEGQLAR
jgi:lysophospholipase L1-like esterase